MPIICPTITAYDDDQYKHQMRNIESFAKRIHIDLMDGEFAPTRSLPIKEIWWPHHLKADLHLMYKQPMEHLSEIIKLKPNLVIIHNEAHIHHMHFAAELHRYGIKAGLAVLSETPIEYTEQIIHSFDHILIFSGNLGYHGGSANLALLEKVEFIKNHHSKVEIGWDGGINKDNAKQLVSAGVTVLNTGGYIQNADIPKDAYATISSVIN